MPTLSQTPPLRSKTQNGGKVYNLRSTSQSRVIGNPRLPFDAARSSCICASVKGPAGLSSTFSRSSRIAAILYVSSIGFPLLTSSSVPHLVSLYYIYLIIVPSLHYLF